MADDRGGHLSVLPMGSLFETAQMIFFELVILKLRPRFGETGNDARAPYKFGITEIQRDAAVR